MKRTASTLAFLAALAGLLVWTSCNTVSKDAGKSPTRLIVKSILGQTDAGQSAAFLQSDVQDLNFATSPATPFVKANTASITLEAELIDPNPVGGSSQYNDITITGYSVSYTLPDGTGVPGTTVPMPITNSLSTLLVKVGTSTTVPFVVVLDSAKLAAPLVALVGTSNTLQVNALIEFTAQDAVGKQVKASGNLPITFADYLDAPPVTPAKR